MADVISPVSGGLAIGESILQFLGYVRGSAGANVISALFDPGANRKEGDKNITVLRHPQDQKGVWWYQSRRSRTTRSCESYPRRLRELRRLL
jgi:hypothetical protein